MDSGLKQCVDVGLISSTMFDSLPNYLRLADPTAVGVTQFVLDHASDFTPAKVKQVAKLFEGYGYQKLASSMTGEDMNIPLTAFCSCLLMCCSVCSCRIC